MSVLYDDSSSQYSEVATAASVAFPFALACWVYIDDLDVDQTFLALANSGSENNHISLMLYGRRKEITEVTTVGDLVSDSLGGTYFELDSPTISYYVWIDVDNGSTDPAPVGRTGIEVDIASGATASQVASAIQAAVDALGDFSASVLADVVTITNTASGSVTDSTDVDTGFTIVTLQQGTDVCFIRARLVDNTGTEEYATASLEPTVNQWHHITGVFSSPAGTTISCYLDGANLGQLTSGSTAFPTGLDTTSIGRLGKQTPTEYASARIAEAAIWNLSTVLSTSEVGDVGTDMIAAWLVRSDELVFYAPMEVQAGTTIVDVISKNSEVTEVTTVADIASDSLGGTYFELDSPTTPYYVWIDVDNGSTDPAPGGRTAIEVDISAGATADQVASAVQAAINALADFSASVATNVVTIINSDHGSSPDATDVDTGFTIATLIQGTDNLNLTSVNAPTDAEHPSVQHFEPEIFLRFRSGPIEFNLTPSNSLALSGTVNIEFLRTASNSFGFNQAVQHNVIVINIQTNISFSQQLNKNTTINISITHSLGLGQNAGKTTEESVSSSVSFTGEAARAEDPSNNILFDQDLDAEASKGVSNDILFTDEVSPNLELTKEVSSGILFGQNVLAYIDAPCERHEYDPQGTGLPTVIFGTTSGITLTCGLDSIVLPNPEFGNTEDSEVGRVLNISRGGTPQLTRDPQWKSNTNISIDIITLPRTKAQELLDFLYNCIGLLVTYTDQDNRQWQGIILNPEEAVVENRSQGCGQYSASIQFVGSPV